MESFIKNLLSGWLQKLNPKVYNTLMVIIAMIEGATTAPGFEELVGGEVAVWVIRIVGFLVAIFTGSSKGPNGVTEPDEEVENVE